MKLDQAIALVKGAATYVPGAYSLLGQKRMTAGGVAPEYFYGVWFKHLTLLNEAVDFGIPSVVAELGPGDAIGVGIAALLSGARRYIGIDATPFAAAGDNDRIASGLIELFRTRAPFVPSGWPDFRHLLDNCYFPSRLLDPARLEYTLAPERLYAIRDAVRRVFRGENATMISYRAPLSDSSLVPDNSVDLVLSHSVLEHVVDIPATIRNTYRWLRPGGCTSHQFDLDSHGIVRGWDGHRAFGDRVWRTVIGTRPFMINRLPFSRIMNAFEDAGFRVIRADRLHRAPTFCRGDLGERWRIVSDDDLETAGGYIVARKP